MKVVINECLGGYSLSEEAYKELGIEWDGYGYAFDDDRTNPKLVEVVERLGTKANGRVAELEVVKIPDDIEWYIRVDNGMECIHEAHRTWE